MVGKKIGFATFGLAFAFAISANAASVTSLWDLGVLNTASDDDVERIIEGPGGGTSIPGRPAAVGQVDIGDVLAGIGNINTLAPPSPGDAVGGTSGVNEWTIEFSIIVHGKSFVGPGFDGVAGTGDDVWNFSFAPDPAFEAIHGSGAMAVFYEDPTPDVTFGSGTIAGDTASATNGSLFWVLGFTGSMVDPGGGASDTDGDEVTTEH